MKAVYAINLGHENLLVEKDCAYLATLKYFFNKDRTCFVWDQFCLVLHSFLYTIMC